LTLIDEPGRDGRNEVHLLRRRERQPNDLAQRVLKAIGAGGASLGRLGPEPREERREAIHAAI